MLQSQWPSTNYEAQTTNEGENSNVNYNFATDGIWGRKNLRNS
jgi:hypothetical protein